ncbi:hypothetical protein AGMMS49928_29290 [Spirochaetia bacterium]|nr:hypothetical protein AGMMS49928_29290 [Spirochaetia bacterium]
MKIGSIVTNCYEFAKMVAFWKEALHYEVRGEISADWAVLTDPQKQGPNMSFQKRDKKRDRRSWIHLDLYAEGKKEQAAEVERLCKIGAKKYPWRYPEGADYVVLEDPDGNLFCVVQK